MKLFGNVLFWIVLALLGALAAQWLLNDPGYVLVRWRGINFPTTAAFAVAALLAILVLLIVIWKLLTLPFRAWRERSTRRSRARLGEGLDALHYGQYDRAEKLLTKAADEDDSVAASARLAAASAAMKRGDANAARVHYDALSERHAAARAIAIAKQALRDDRPTDALVALDLPAAQPLPPRGLALRAEALAASGHSAEAYGLLGSMRKQAAWPAARIDEAQERWAAASLREAQDGNALADRWQALPKNLQAEPAVVSAYAERAQALGWDDAASKAVEQALDTRWDERLANRYGNLRPMHASTRHTAYERWLQAHPSSPSVLLGLSRENRERGQLAASHDYLQRALAQGAGADAWEELGNSYAAAGDEQRARIAYANALRAGRGEQPQALPQDRDFASQPTGQIAPEERDEHGMPRLRE